MIDLKEMIERELDQYLEWPTADKSHVTTASAKLFAEHVARLYSESKPAPDVSALVEALDQCITSMLDSGYRADAVVIRAARTALAAHRKQEGGV